MPVESKYALKVCVTDATEQRFAEFLRNFSTPQEGRKRFALFPFGSGRRKKQKTIATSSASSLSVSPADDQDDSIPSDSGSNEEIRTSFANQHGIKIGTMTFPSKEACTSVLEQYKGEKRGAGYGYEWRDWHLSSDFQGITVLYEHEGEEDSITMDICAVHGLGGNAMDTWTVSGEGLMWLRDFLPSSDSFKKSRIMTFGYDSDLTDRRTVATVETWADSLLHSLDQVRTSEQERTRPLLFVCHSLGGLVARKAMTQLPGSSVKGITLSQCGLIFLATPHSGTTKADWNNCVMAAAETVTGLRPEVLSTFQSFNSASVGDKQDFLRLKPCPPFQCYAEGWKTRIAGTNQLVVTRDSATLDPVKAASVIHNKDHSGICKCSHTHGSYITLKHALSAVFEEVTQRLETDREHEHRIFGHPYPVAHAYPPNNGLWWEGNEMHEIRCRLASESLFVGRNEDMKKLESTVARIPARQKLTVVKGIAGIGKTELLMRFAEKIRQSRSIFFFRAQKSKKLEDALATVCNNIGFDIIEDPNMNRERWRQAEPSERIRIFIEWLGNDSNKKLLLILDDAEMFGATSVRSALEYPARHVLIATRDSNLEDHERECQHLPLAPLTTNDTVSLLQHSLNKFLQENPELRGGRNGRDLQSLATAIHGHPLAARNLISFLLKKLGTYEDPTKEFIRVLDNGTEGERKSFLKYKVGGRSLWDAFNSSLELLRQEEGSESVVELLQLLPYLRTDQDCIDSFLKLSKKDLQPRAGVPTHGAVLRSEYLVVDDWLEKLQGVSFLVSTGVIKSKWLDIHPLVLQFAQLLPSDKVRKQQIRETLLLFYELFQQQRRNQSHVTPHVNHCLRICSRFKIKTQNLDLSPSMISWLKTFHTAMAQPAETMRLGQKPEDSSMEDEVSIKEKAEDFILQCARTQKKLKDIDGLDGDGQNQYLVLKCVQLFRELKNSLTHDAAYCCLGSLERLEDAVSSLSEMLILMNICPSLLPELGEFRRRFYATPEISTDGTGEMELD